MSLPPEIIKIIAKLEKAGFEAYAVGGCVRDLLLNKKPKDWDIATNAKPEQIQKIFPNSFYENKFGTVGVKTDNSEPELAVVEITTYRLEQKYSDKRHPDKIRLARNWRDDLARRDFTINALALAQQLTSNKNKQQVTYKIIDLFNGERDLEQKIIRAVGEPSQRFNEDALRMLRAIRLATELNFNIEPKTMSGIKENSFWLSVIAKERIKDEFSKIIMSDDPAKGIELLRECGLLKYVMPELEKGIGVNQNRHHIYTIYEHSVFTLKFAAQKKYNLEVRLASLLHDIAKPETKAGEGPDSTFYNHDIVGAKFAIRILERLKFPKKTIEKVALLVRNHMFVYDVDAVTEAGVRRLLRRAGPENIDDLIKVRIADRLGSGCPKAEPYKLRHLKYLIEKVSKDPISVKMLKIKGDEVMKILGLKPGQRIGLLLNGLLSEALENPKINTKAKLTKRLKELNELPDQELKNKDKVIKEKKQEVEMEMKGKYWVK